MRTGAADAARAVDAVSRSALDAAKSVDALGEAQDAVYGGGTKVYTQQETAARKAAEAAAAHREQQVELARSAESLASKQEQAKKALQGTAAAVAGLATVRNLIAQFQEGGNSVEAFSNAALLGAQALLNLERVLETIPAAAGAAAAAEDALAVAEGAAATGATTLTAALAANPLTAVAAVLATASVAMSLFADKTDDAAEAQKRLADAITSANERSRLLSFQQQSGQYVDPADELKAKIQQLNELVKTGLKPEYTAQDLAPLLGMTPDQLKAQRPYDIATDARPTKYGNRIVEGRYTQESAQQLFADAVRRFSGAIDKVETERGTVIGPMPQETQPQGGTGPTYGPSYKEFLDANAQASAQASGPRAEASAYIAQLQETLRLMKMTRDEREVEQALQRAGVDLTNEEATAVRALVEQQQELSRTQADNEQRMAQLRAEAKAHYAEEAQRQKQRYEDYKNNATAQYDYLESLRDQTRIAGMSNEEGQKELAVLQAINIAKQNNQILSESEKQSIRDQIDLQQQLSRLKEISASVDSALSGAFTGFITGAQTARQAVAALIQQMIALASQQAFRGATSSLFNLFAPTGNQVSSSLPNGGMSTSTGGLA
jgi:hypothetical protein